jgi:uncharacterized membrane protein
MANDINSIFRRVLRYFFSGTIFIVPLVATVYVIYISFRTLDELINLPYPGLGFALIFIAITAFGYLTTNLAFRTFTNWMDRGVNKIPLIKLIYTALKDLLSAFVGDKKKFNKPVLVEINKENKLFQIGFITQNDLRELGLHDMVSVYLPHSYAFSGLHYIIPKDRVTPLNVSGTVAMKYIVSGGVSGLNVQP